MGNCSTTATDSMTGEQIHSVTYSCILTLKAWLTAEHLVATSLLLLSSLLSRDPLAI